MFLIHCSNGPPFYTIMLHIFLKVRSFFGKYVKFTLKLWQSCPQFVTILPSKDIFMKIWCCQKAPKMYKICNINVYTWVWPPTLYPVEQWRAESCISVAVGTVGYLIWQAWIIIEEWCRKLATMDRYPDFSRPRLDKSTGLCHTLF